MAGMTDDIWTKRHQQLVEALKQAARDLLAHQNIRPALMEIPLGDNLWVTIGPQADEEKS